MKDNYDPEAWKAWAPIQQDMERFAKLANSPINIPRDHTAPLDFKPTRTVIRERRSKLNHH